MKQGNYKIKENKALTPLIWQMVLEGDTSALRRSGEFINIQIDGLFLRRPISVCDFDDKSITVIYKVVGKGTEAMSKMREGSLDCLTGLGNGYDTAVSGDHVLLLGGGVGVPPLYHLCKELLSEGKSVHAVLGFNTKDEVFYDKEFKALGAKVTVATADGSMGIRGFVTDAMDEEYSYFYTCGPLPMLKAVYEKSKTSGQFSFEERMGCGFGACMGCSCKTLFGNKRVCKDGPVFKKEEILWQ